MLITFTCDAHETLIMFGDVGQKLLAMMGYPGKSIGTIPPEDIAAVRTRLRSALEENKKTQPVFAAENNKTEDANEPEVSLEHRAFPLFEMLDAAEKENCEVKWKSS